MAYSVLRANILKKTLKASKSKYLIYMPIFLPMRFETEPLLWSVDNVYTKEECEDFVQYIENSCPTLATNNPMYRNQDRVIKDDAQVANDLFRRLRPHLQEQIGSFKLIGLNERFRMYRYRAGQQFSPHTDHWYRPNENQITLHTVLIYFNDDFTGGETQFYEQLEKTITPKCGSALIFQHKIRHEGCLVKSGVKYAMRSDVIYETSESIIMPGL